MDSVRFGRALGIGARAAAKTLVTAADAATSPNPSAKATAEKPAAGGHPKENAAAASGTRLGQQAARTTTQVRQTGKGLKQGTKRFGGAMWGPFVKLSGVLWLEVTGVFFGIFALFAGADAWKMRGEMRITPLNHDGHAHFLWAIVMAAIFAYFCVTSFVNARRRERRR